MKSFTGDTQFGEYNTVYRTVTPENIPDTRVSESNLPYFPLNLELDKQGGVERRVSITGKYLLIKMNFTYKNLF